MLDDNVWLTYDDKDSVQMEAGFARLNDVMVWAISHDTRDAKYSKALAELAPDDTTLVNDTKTRTTPSNRGSLQTAVSLDHLQRGLSGGLDSHDAKGQENPGKTISWWPAPGVTVMAYSK